jgi:hypothetical protein
MTFLLKGGEATVTVPIGQSIAVGALRGSAAQLLIPNGFANGPIALINNSAKTFGPYYAEAVLTIHSIGGPIEYVVGVTPILTDGVNSSVSTSPATPTTLGLVTPGYSISVDSNGALSTDAQAATSRGKIIASCYPAAVSTLATPLRVALRQAGRYKTTIKNKSPTFTVQISTDTYGADNSNRTAPTTGFVDVLPLKEFVMMYPAGQFWARPKVDAQLCIMDIETENFS